MIRIGLETLTKKWLKHKNIEATSCSCNYSRNNIAQGAHLNMGCKCFLVSLVFMMPHFLFTNGIFIKRFFNNTGREHT